MQTDWSQFIPASADNLTDNSTDNSTDAPGDAPIDFNDFDNFGGFDHYNNNGTSDPDDDTFYGRDTNAADDGAEIYGGGGFDYTQFTDFGT